MKAAVASKRKLRRLPAWWKALSLAHGAHKTCDDGMCAMEAAAKLAGEPHTDNPECVDRAIGAVMRKLNDRIAQPYRDEVIKPLTPRTLFTRSTREVEWARAYVAADWACRVFAPIALETRGYKKEAERARALPEVRDKSSAITARDELRASSRTTAAAYTAAYTAAYAADAAAAAATDAAAAAATYAAAAYTTADAAAAYAAAATAAATDAAAYAAAATDAAAYAAAATADATAARRRVYGLAVNMVDAMIAVGGVS